MSVYKSIKGGLPKNYLRAFGIGPGYNSKKQGYLTDEDLYAQTDLPFLNPLEGMGKYLKEIKNPAARAAALVICGGLAFYFLSDVAGSSPDAAQSVHVSDSNGEEHNNRVVEDHAYSNVPAESMTEKFPGDLAIEDSAKKNSNEEYKKYKVLLHVHTKESDGENLDYDFLIRNKIDCVIITDHDKVRPVASEVKKGKDVEGEILVIYGVEETCNIDGHVENEFLRPLMGHVLFFPTTYQSESTDLNEVVTEHMEREGEIGVFAHPFEPNGEHNGLLKEYSGLTFEKYNGLAGVFFGDGFRELNGRKGVYGVDKHKNTELDRDSDGNLDEEVPYIIVQAEELSANAITEAIKAGRFDNVSIYD